MSESSQSVESLEYRTEVKQLLDILAHSLYTDRDIFLRELISNASDALNRVQFEMLTNEDVYGADQELAIYLATDEEAGRITVSDTGIGMDRDELVMNLGTIAHSGARTFMDNVQSGQSALEEIIGQFGVGFYSVFMVAAEVSVVSRSYRPDDRAWQWRSSGDSQYTLEPAERQERGTTITITLKDDAKEFANAWRLEQIVRKHSDYVSFPIHLEIDGEDRVVNRQTALWRTSPNQVSDEEYEEFYKQLTFDTEGPLTHVHVVADAPVNLRSVLFIPQHRERGMLHLRPDHGLRLYSRKILIQEFNKDLLPEYYRFVDGVVDSEDLPLNVSREMVQSNPVLRQIQRALTGRVNRELKRLAEERPDGYDQFWREFGVFVKEGVATDMSSRGDLVGLLRFQSTKSGDELISIKQYVERMAEDQESIYYVLGDDIASVARSPHLDYFRAHDIEVLYLVDPIDGYMTSMLHEVEDKKLQNVDDAGLSLPEDEADGEKSPALADDEFDALVAKFKDVLGDRVRDVRASHQLVSSPCRLVSPEDSFDRDLERLRRLTEEGYEAPKKVLELNRNHAMIVNLAHAVAHKPDEPLVEAAIEQLLDNALLLDGVFRNPADMVDRIQMLMEVAVASQAGEE